MATLRSQDFTYDIVDALDGLMDTLITASAALSPKLSYNYSTHNIAKLQLNAVSLDLDNATCELAGADAAHRMLWRSQWSFRIHTGYYGETVNTIDTHRLMTDVAVQLCENWNLGSEKFIESIEMENNQSWEDSQTVGGELRIVIIYDTSYTQD